MRLSLVETKALSEMAQLLYDFMPSSFFASAAKSVGLSHLWMGGSKLPAIIGLLEMTLETERSKFCDLVLEIVRTGIKYSAQKGKPITRESIQELNELISKIHFKIPDLWDPTFLDTLPSVQPESKKESPIDQDRLNKLKDSMVKLGNLDPQARGFAFEKLLNELFAINELSPRSSFRLVGEQIDGSFQIGTNTYLVEAKWHEQQVGQQDLLVFREKVESKAAWSRGLFISHSGFTQDGLEAFSKGRCTNLIGMDGQDIYMILEGEMSLVEAINRKDRRAAETGEFFVSVFEMSRKG